jgi:uncharacterized membrane protein
VLAAAPVWVIDLHAWWAWVVVVGNGVAGTWALVAHRYPQARARQLWWFTAVAQISIFVQAVLGVVLLQGRDLEPYRMHVFYGFVAAFSVAIVYSYRSQLRDRQYLLYGFGGLFLMGLGIRGMVLHP